MITLRSESLNYKWGFDDGDVLDDILYSSGLSLERPRGAHLWYEHEVLARVVERFLLPLIPGVDVFRIGTSHNPIRAQNKDAPEGVSVSVSESDVLSIAREVAAEYRAGGVLEAAK